MSDISWTTCKHAKPSDILFIEQARGEAGIYAGAIVASTATVEAPGDHPFFVNPEDARKLARMGPLEPFQNLKHPTLEYNLKTILLERIAKWLHLQRAACHLVDEEGEAIDRLIEASDAA
jgi:hypothetical protein